MPHIRRSLLDPVRLMIAALLAILIAASATQTASAGGWAVASLDAVPAPTAGESTDVGFTVLQHGQTPAVLDADVGIELVLADGSTRFFAAVADGVPGHYVATVTFPETDGSYGWNVRMGWFGSYELGSIDVAAPRTATDGRSRGGWIWPDVRWLVLTASIVLGGIAIVDTVIARRRRRTVAA